MAHYFGVGLVPDRWPVGLSPEQDVAFKAFLTRESEARGYDDRISAYHDLDPVSR